MPNNVNILALHFNDLSKMKLSDIGKAVDSEVFVVYGSSWIKNEIGEFLDKKNAINIHLGISPYYRGTATTFWPLYDKRPLLVGATIHKLVYKLDAGKIYNTVIPKITDNTIISNCFDFTMMVSKVAQDVLIEKLKSRDLWRTPTLLQDSKLELRYSKDSHFTADITKDFLNNLPSLEYIKESQSKINDNNFINPIIVNC